jgi:hypothetical protein
MPSVSPGSVRLFGAPRRGPTASSVAGTATARAASGRRERARRRCGAVLPVSVAENIARGTGYPRRAGLVSWRRYLVSQGSPTDHSLPAWGTSSARNWLTTPPRPRPAARPSAVSSEQHQAATVPEPPSPQGR